MGKIVSSSKFSGKSEAVDFKKLLTNVKKVIQFYCSRTTGKFFRNGSKMSTCGDNWEFVFSEWIFSRWFTSRGKLDPTIEQGALFISNTYHILRKEVITQENKDPNN